MDYKNTELNLHGIISDLAIEFNSVGREDSSDQVRSLIMIEKYKN